MIKSWLMVPIRTKADNSSFLDNIRCFMLMLRISPEISKYTSLYMIITFKFVKYFTVK